MIIASEQTLLYRNDVNLIAVPMVTVWGYRIERHGVVVASRPNGAMDCEAALELAKAHAEKLARLRGWW